MSRSANFFGKISFFLIVSICTIQLSALSFALPDPSSHMTSEKTATAIHAIKAVCDDGILRIERTRGRISTFFALFFAAKTIISRREATLASLWQCSLPSLLIWRADIGATFESAPQSDMVLLN